MFAKLRFAGVCALSAFTLSCSPADPLASTIAAPMWAPLVQQALPGSWVPAEVSNQPVPATSRIAARLKFLNRMSAFHPLQDFFGRSSFGSTERRYLSFVILPLRLTPSRLRAH